MRFQARSSSSAVLVALCTLLMAGCGGGTLSEGSAGADSSGDALGGSSSRPNTGTTEGAPEAEEAEEDEGVTLCHLPPGNPANAHTITVGEPAVKAHLRHGDTLGACDGSSEPTPDAGTPPTDPPPDAGTPPTGTDAGTTDPGPTCKGPNETCGDGRVCCAGLVCQSGVCTPEIN